MMPIKAFEGSMGGEALWQNAQYIAPSKMRSKKYDTFQKKRQIKEQRKEYKENLLEEGKDPNSYLEDAFQQDSEQSD